MLTLPPALHRFAETLKTEGVELYAVGGCVRDALLNRGVHDIDLASKARPDELLEKAKANGIAARIVQQTLGTVLLSIDGIDYEHTTFRTESYGAGGEHRPEAVRFSDSPEMDAFRRDFSVNALYQAITDGTVIDPTGGLNDLRDRVLRTTTGFASCGSFGLRRHSVFRSIPPHGRRRKRMFPCSRTLRGSGSGRSSTASFWDPAYSTRFRCFVRSERSNICCRS